MFLRISGEQAHLIISFDFGYFIDYFISFLLFFLFIFPFFFLFFKITINRYEVSPTYPKVFLVPNTIDDETLAQVLFLFSSFSFQDLMLILFYCFHILFFFLIVSHFLFFF